MRFRGPRSSTVERLICNQRVGGSNPSVGSKKEGLFYSFILAFLHSPYWLENLFDLIDLLKLPCKVFTPVDRSPINLLSQYGSFFPNLVCQENRTVPFSSVG